MSNCFSKWLYHVTCPISSIWSFSCLTSLSTRDMVNLLNFSQFNGYLVISHYGSNVHFSWWQMNSPFTYLPTFYLPWWSGCLLLVPICYWVVYCIEFWVFSLKKIFWIQSLKNMQFSNIFFKWIEIHFLFLIWTSNNYSNIYWKDYSFCTECTLQLHWKTIGLISVGLFLDSPFSFPWCQYHPALLT